MRDVVTMSCRLSLAEGIHKMIPAKTRKATEETRTTGFWGYPQPPHDYPYHWFILDPKSKQDKSQSYKFKKFAKKSNLEILQDTLHATHILNLLGKMCKYEIDPASIVEDTEWTPFCPQMDGPTDRRSWTPPPPPPFSFIEMGGIIILVFSLIWSS